MIDFVVPDDARVTRCTGCPAMVAWVPGKTGKMMPLAWEKRVVVDGVTRAPSHFADCPKAKEFRRK